MHWLQLRLDWRATTCV